MTNTAPEYRLVSSEAERIAVMAAYHRKMEALFTRVGNASMAAQARAAAVKVEAQASA